MLIKLALCIVFSGAAFCFEYYILWKLKTGQVIKNVCVCACKSKREWILLILMLTGNCWVQHLCAVPTIFIGMDFGKANVPWWATWILVIWVIFHIVIELSLEVHQCCTYKKNKGTGYRIITLHLCFGLHLKFNCWDYCFSVSQAVRIK